ncbi:SUZ domain [Popillia japonica]|uniref:SUZ domain n=2 Tax=Popillia japonica TaxID=7064 RepID=A0AAW1MEP6_POPJA
MQQRGTNTTMNFDCEEKTSPPQVRGRGGTGLTFSSSRNHSPINPYVVVSPSISRNGSPSRSSANLCISPTATLTPSPTLKHSPRTLSPHSDCTILQSEFIEVDGGSPKMLSNVSKTNGRREELRVYRTDVIVEEDSSQRNCNGKKNECNCVSQNCNRCLKSQDRNFNNNLSSNINNNVVCSQNSLTVNRANLRGKLKQQSSCQGSFEGSLCNSPCLSRDNSSEQYFTDTTGVDLERFIPETLNKNAKDRALMLRIEQELVSLAKDDSKTHYKFPPMSSYQRMLVHRCAAYFGMDHNIEPAGNEEPRRSILKRDSNSMEDYSFKSPNRQSSLENRRSKSIEEREEEYQKAKKRIFNEMRESGSTDEFGWPEQAWSSMESDNLSRFRLQLPDHSGRSSGRLLKVHSEESHDERLRPCVAKSNSFGGYCGTHGRDNGMSNAPRLLTKQDSAASSVSWRLSPSSSGYKTQSQRSESVTPSPTSTPYMSGDSIRQDSTASVATNTSEQPSPSDEHGSEPAVWVLTDLHNTPKGSVIINPQTGQPLKNQDGSTYHYDPSNPPPNLVLSNPPLTKPPPSPQKQQPSPQKIPKERPPSPKKRSKSSPIKKCSVTNSSTSPSLPFTPPPAQNRNYQYVTPVDSTANVPVQPQQFSVYGQNYPTNVPDNSVSLYPQSYLVYSPFNVPVQYDNRIQESQIPDVTYFVPENGPHATTVYQSQPPPSWSQTQLPLYQTPSTIPQRYNVPVHQQSTSFVSTYPTNYVPHTPNPQNPEVAQMYQQPVQVIYASQPPQPTNSMIYPPNQSVVYAQNPVYQNPPVYSNQSNHINYPQCSSTPSACPPPPGTVFCSQVFDQTIPQSGMQHLSQNMSQLSLNSGGFIPAIQKSVIPPNTSMDYRGKAPTPKGNKFSNPKNFGIGSSHSSTEANSPAMTVIAGYCQNQPGAVYRPPSETPPTHGAYPGNFISTPPMMLRQVNNIRASPPVTNRSSRSPTPASDITDRQRMMFPPLYQGIPYVLQPDRLVTGRGPPNAYRAPIRQQSLPHGTDNKAHKNRKTRGKVSNLPPNGKQSNQ